MTSEMTIEREAFEKWYADNAFNYGRDPIGSRECGLQWAAWQGRARLAQPAQAVDVDSLAQEIRRVDGSHSLGAAALAEALTPFITRALSGEKAGPVDGWKLVPVEPTPAMRAAFRADPEALTHFTHTTLQCADFDSRYRAMLGAASPAPDKE